MTNRYNGIFSSVKKTNWTLNFWNLYSNSQIRPILYNINGWIQIHLSCFSKIEYNTIDRHKTALTCKSVYGCHTCKIIPATDTPLLSNSFVAIYTVTAEPSEWPNLRIGDKTDFLQHNFWGIDLERIYHIFEHLQTTLFDIFFWDGLSTHINISALMYLFFP